MAKTKKDTEAKKREAERAEEVISEGLSAKQRARQEEFKEAYILAFGNVSRACKAISMSRQTVFLWKRDDPEFKAWIENPDLLTDTLEHKLDFLESQLLEAQRKGNVTAILAELNNKGGSRGWGKFGAIGASDGPRLIRPATMPEEEPEQADQEEDADAV